MAASTPATPTPPTRRRRRAFDASTAIGRVYISTAACQGYANVLQRRLGAHALRRPYTGAGASAARARCVVCGAATEGTMYVGCSANPWAPCCAGHLRQKNDE